MQVGIKVGPDDWQKKLDQTDPDCSEIWFRLDWYEKYQEMFKYLNKKEIPFGLHFWATVDEKYFPCLLYTKRDIAEKSYQKILKTIDIASKHNAEYVNFHPEAYRLTKLDLDKKTIKVVDEKEPIDRKKSFEQFLFYLNKIQKYAKQKKVIPYVETVPKYMPEQFKNIRVGRLSPLKSEGMETDKYIRLAEKNYPICLDFGHTIAQLITDDKKEVFKYLYNTAKKIKPSIGLIHITTTVPPFNGTDCHHGILEADFKAGALPNKKQLIKLLKLFKDKDVWLIPEPQYEKLIENTLELKELLKQI